MMALGKPQVTAMLEAAGIEVGGGEPWDVHVRDERVYRRMATHGLLGVGEAYMDGWWDCDRLDRMAERMLLAGAYDALDRSPPAALLRLRSRLWNLDSRRRAHKVGKHHYDIGNDLYERMLDARMVYSCGYWKGLDTRGAGGLDAAQEAKLDLVCRKLGLEEGMRVLDIGCGWGSFAKFAAERYGVHVTGLTVSREQRALARAWCRGLDVDVRLQDYRAYRPEGPFDRVVSIGMFEHVGHKNHRAFMRAAHRCLRPRGLMLLHTIGTPRSEVSTDPWTHKYIFPNGHLPSTAQVGRAADGLFFLEDVHGFGQFYDPTLMAWHANAETAWDDLPYDERFRRMWRFYLLTAAASFRTRRIQLWQFVYARGQGVPGGYEPVR